MKKVFGIASITTTTTALLIAACSAPDPSGGLQQQNQNVEPGGSKKKDSGASNTDKGGDKSGDKGGDKGGDTTPGNDGGTTTATGPCADKATFEQCAICCEEKNPKGADHYYGALDNCLCVTPGPCKTACAATICNANPKAPDQACITCLESQAADACYETAGKSCEGNADCQQLLKCDGESQCSKKPD